VSYGSYDTAPVTGTRYQPASKPCNICGEPITWGCRIEGRPAHIDASGFVIGDGRCPGPKKRAAPDAKYQATPRPPTPGNFLKLFEEARVQAIQASAKMHAAIVMAESIIENAASANGLSREAVEHWNKLTNAERAAYLAERLEQAGFPTDHPAHAHVLIARAEKESDRWFAGCGAIDVLLNWCDIAGISLPFEVRT